MFAEKTMLDRERQELQRFSDVDGGDSEDDDVHDNVGLYDDVVVRGSRWRRRFVGRTRRTGR